MKAFVAALLLSTGAYAITEPVAAQTITADNGAVFQIHDIRAGKRGDGKFYALAFVTDEDRHTTIFTFTCDGHYSASVGVGVESGWRTIPSRSVLARIDQIVCKAAGI